MSGVLEQTIQQFRLLMQCVIGRGRVALVDDSQVIQAMQVTLNPNEVIDNLKHMGEFGFVSNPPVGSDVLAVFIAGDRSNGAVIGTNHQATRKKNLSPGEAAMHDSLGKYVYLTATGIVINAGGQPVTVNGATTVTINASGGVIMETPYLKVSGDIYDNYHTTPESAANLRTIYDSHTHGGVQTGGGNTAVPNQLE